MYSIVNLNKVLLKTFVCITVDDNITCDRFHKNKSLILYFILDIVHRIKEMENARRLMQFYFNSLVLTGLYFHVQCRWKLGQFSLFSFSLFLVTRRNDA